MAAVPSGPRLLMVDDDPSALFIYKTHLARAGYQVVCASNLLEAASLLSEQGTQAFGAVVTDFWMPGGSGVDLLRKVRQWDKTLSVILITAEGDKEHVAQSLREGAHNFLDKPVSGPVLRDAVSKAVDATLRQRAQRETLLEAKALGDTQRLLLGRQAEGFGGRLGLFSRPHAQAGGDFAGVFWLARERFVVLVSDVSGHDLTAAYCSAYLQGIARGLFDRGAGIQDVFERLNRLILDEWNKAGVVELSLAACAADVDLGRGTLTTLNCGLPPPRLTDGEGWTEALEEKGAHPLGWFDELPLCRTQELRGGYLSFWSDGLEDAAERLAVSPLALAGRLQSRAHEADSLLGEAVGDDIVAVRLDLRAHDESPASQRFPVLAERIAGSRAVEIDALQSYLERSLRTAFPAATEDAFDDIVLCLREALLNALVHGCLGKPDRFARLQIAHDLKASELNVRILDDGEGHLFDFDRHAEQAADELIPEHRGLVLVKNLAKRMHLSPRGNRLSMDFPLNNPNPATS